MFRNHCTYKGCLGSWTFIIHLMHACMLYVSSLKLRNNTTRTEQWRVFSILLFLLLLHSDRLRCGWYFHSSSRRRLSTGWYFHRLVSSNGLSPGRIGGMTVQRNLVQIGINLLIHIVVALLELTLEIFGYSAFWKFP